MAFYWHLMFLELSGSGWKPHGGPAISKIFPLAMLLDMEVSINKQRGPKIDHTYVYIYMYVHIYIYRCTYIYIYTCVCIYIYTYVCIYVILIIGTPRRAHVRKPRYSALLNQESWADRTQFRAPLRALIQAL